MRDRLRERGWSFRGSADPKVLRELLSTRFPAVPESLVQFLASAEGAVSPDRTTWFLNALDYGGSSDAAFEWNAWERLSLEAAGDDEEWSSDIRAFWTVHVPFLLSVRDGYSYIALALMGVTAGSVVFGREPEFEDVNVLAPSMEVFSAEVQGVLAGSPVRGPIARGLLGGDAG